MGNPGDDPWNNVVDYDMGGLGSTDKSDPHIARVTISYTDVCTITLDAGDVLPWIPFIPPPDPVTACSFFLPEPGTVLLLLVGGVLGLNRRRRNSG